MFLNRIFIAKRKSTQSMHLNAGGRPCRLKPPQRAFLTMARLGAGSKEQSILETAVAWAVATFTMEYCRAASNCLNPLQSDHLDTCCVAGVWLLHVRSICFVWHVLLQPQRFDVRCQHSGSAMTRKRQIKRRPESVVTVYSRHTWIYNYIRYTSICHPDVHAERAQVCLAFCSIAGAWLDSSKSAWHFFCTPPMH